MAFHHFVSLAASLGLIAAVSSAHNDEKKQSAPAETPAKTLASEMPNDPSRQPLTKAHPAASVMTNNS